MTAIAESFTGAADGPWDETGGTANLTTGAGAPIAAVAPIDGPCGTMTLLL
jgi:hypothetical protein